MKIFDCFLLFNELDLLEIRFNYLYSHVDYFIIVESEITFQGELKEFNFEKNKNRFSKFLDKIIYYKIYSYSFDFNNLPYIQLPVSDDDYLVNQIFFRLENCRYFDKNQFWWGNDFYQRESIIRALDLIKPNDDDIILLSDADEIINVQLIQELRFEIKKDYIYYCKQYEFYYYLNYYHNSDWIGTSCFLYGEYKNISLNSIRFATRREENLSTVIIENSGWHFTSLGNVNAIQKKIKSWGHKEFNNKLILRSLEYNITHGYDIFRRKNFGKLTYLSPEDNLLKPLFKNDIIDFTHLIGPPLKTENWFSKIIFSIYFKIARRFY